MRISTSAQSRFRIQLQFIFQFVFFALHNVLDIVAIYYSFSADGDRCGAIVESLRVGGILFFIIHVAMISSFIVQFQFISCGARRLLRWFWCLVAAVSVSFLTFGLHSLLSVVWIPIQLNAMNHSRHVCFAASDGGSGGGVGIWIFSHIYLIWVCLSLGCFCCCSDYFKTEHMLRPTIAASTSQTPEEGEEEQPPPPMTIVSIPNVENDRRDEKIITTFVSNAIPIV